MWYAAMGCMFLPIGFLLFIFYISHMDDTIPNFPISQYKSQFIRTKDHYWLNPIHIKGFKVYKEYKTYGIKAYVSGISYPIADGFQSSEDAHQWLEQFLNREDVTFID